MKSVKRVRGPQKQPTYVHINLRVSREVYQFFSSGNMSERIRVALDEYVAAHTGESKSSS